MAEILNTFILGIRSILQGLSMPGPLDSALARELYAYLLRAQFAIAALIIPVLLFIAAPYGRHYRSGWGPKLSSRAAWLVMETPAVFTIAAMYLVAAPQGLAWLYIVIWEIHYVYRTFIFPALLRHPSRTFPLVVALSAIGFNLMNGYVNGYALFVGRATLAWYDLVRVHTVAGLLLFFGGLALNIQSDAIIRALRRDREAGGPRYAIPYGGAFRYVSNPNYLGEIVEWIGWAIFTSTIAGWAFAVFTFANLMPRAVANHRWYQETFPDYPPERHILIPFIF